jgi:uncharacterized damage-inducible protein DinB
MRIALWVAALSFTAGPAAGQQPGASDAKAALAGGFTEVAGWVARAAELVPADQYGYRPVESVRTVGQLIGHIADAHNYYCARAGGRNVEWSDPVEKGPADKATLLRQLTQSIETCNAAYAANGRADQLTGNLGHTSLHYGNLITYLRMLGLTPPSS